jgi:hypothetical protein
LQQYLKRAERLIHIGNGLCGLFTDHQLLQDCIGNYLVVLQNEDAKKEQKKKKAGAAKKKKSATTQQTKKKKHSVEEESDDDVFLSWPAKHEGLVAVPDKAKTMIWHVSARMIWPGHSYRSISNPTGQKAKTEAVFHEVRFKVILGK